MKKRGAKMIDFAKLIINREENLAISPRDIFGTLTDKDSKYDYLRHVQTEVMDKWFLNKEKKDTIIKMNTGSGKTVVGLLILQSCLEEKKGPAVYVAPDPYLVSQVIDEANKLGIKVTENEDSIDFISGDSILVINIFKLINGKSKFGVGERKIDIGSIIIDDAHACLDSTEDQFTLRIDKETDCYTELYNLIREDLLSQCSVKVHELDEGISSTYI